MSRRPAAASFLACNAPSLDIIADVGHIRKIGRVKRLKRHRFKEETRASITNELARGTFTATFFLATLAALECEGVRLEDV